MVSAEFHPGAASEVEEARLWYEAQRPELGEAFATAVEDGVAGLLETLSVWPADASGVRSYLIERFPYRIAYVAAAESVLILAGTTTIGTQAAVEFVCQQESLEKLLPRLAVSENGELKPFEAVLRIKVTRGVPVESDIVALRAGKP